MTSQLLRVVQWRMLKIMTVKDIFIFILCSSLTIADAYSGKCSKGTCKKGVCYTEGGEEGFLCSCPIFRTGPRCDKESYPCSSCKKTARVDCIGLPDGTARCICTEWKYKAMKNKPSAICYYLKAKKHRQKLCKTGKHSCGSAQECVNYAQSANNMQMTCQCPAGDRRGDNCREDYKKVAFDGQSSCTQIKGHKPICLCQKYANQPGFCKPQQSNGRPPIIGESSKTSNPGENENTPTSAENKKTSSSGETKKTSTSEENKKTTTSVLPAPSRELPVQREKIKIPSSDQCSKRTCGKGNCFTVGSVAGFVCSCPMFRTGPRCEKVSYPCSSCQKTARVDCIGLPDGTARCICTEWRYKAMKKVPTSICYYLKAKKHRQKTCEKGNHLCGSAQQCVNYAQAEKNTQMTCQCPLGLRRGNNCQEDYKIVPLDGQSSCTQIKGQDPICLCQKYERQPGFCKAQQTDGRQSVLGGNKSAPTFEQLKPPAKSKTEKISSSGQCSKGACKKGACVPVGNKVGYFCSCPIFKTGPGCDKVSYPCSSCKDKRRVECVGLSDGTARCICTEWKYKKMKKIPTSICYYLKAKKHRQKACKSGKHSCGPGQECVNYAQAEKNTQMTCQCPAGERRGDNCHEDYKSIVPDEKTSCTQTAEGGVICLCNEYGRYDDGPGFCKATFRVKNSNDEFEEKKYTRPSLRHNNAVNPRKDNIRPTSSSNNTRISKKKDSNQSSREKKKNVKTNITAPHLLDPDTMKPDPCSSRPCLHDGICRPHPSKPDDFTCVCPLGKKGRVCDKKITDCDSLGCTKKKECLSTPEGAFCICTAHFQEQTCSIKMRNITEWEKLKIVMAPRTLHGIEIAAILLLVSTGLTLIYLIIHCIRVSSKRKEYKEKYEKVVKKGEVPTAPLPDWLDVSNDMAKQSLCCGASKLPKSFAPKKKKNKKKKKKKKKDVDEAEDKNENFPSSKRRYSKQYTLNKSENSKGSVRRKDSTRTANNMRECKLLTAKLNGNNQRNDVKTLRQEYVKEYIKNHQIYFQFKRPNVRNLTNKKYSEGTYYTWKSAKPVRSSGPVKHQHLSDSTNSGRFQTQRVYSQKYRRFKPR